MRRTLKPGILGTFGVVAGSGMIACSGVGHSKDPEPPTRNPPPIELTTVHATLPAAPFTAGQSLEASDPQKGTIHHGSGSCWIDLPFDTPPTSVVPPKTERVVCPPEILKDPAYAACDGGEIHVLDLGPPVSCICYFWGNPPPSPKDVACPTTAIPSLASNEPHPEEPIHRNPPPPQH
jgi:hypothetical protein